MGKPKPHKTNKPEIRNGIVASIAQGKSQMETAKETGVSVSTISRLVSPSGMVETPRLPGEEKFCEILKG